MKRKSKEERKNRLKEHKVQEKLVKKQQYSKYLEQKKIDKNKEQLSRELVKDLTLADKIGLSSTIANEILTNPEEKYRKLNDLLVLCKDREVDVIVKAVEALCKVYKDIIPAYKIREHIEGDGKKLSKEVIKLR